MRVLRLSSEVNLDKIELTIVELHGLVGSRACLILSRVLAQPKVEVIGQRLGLRVFLVCLKRGNPR